MKANEVEKQAFVSQRRARIAAFLPVLSAEVVLRASGLLLLSVLLIRTLSGSGAN